MIILVINMVKISSIVHVVDLLSDERLLCQLGDPVVPVMDAQIGTILWVLLDTPAEVFLHQLAQVLGRVFVN